MTSAIICPFDCAECRRVQCTSGWCEQTGDRTLASCSDCGAPGVALARVHVCVACIGVRFERGEPN